MLPPPVESQGLLTTKAPLWVTSSLLPILAATSLNPPSLLVTNKRQQAAVRGASPFIWGLLPANACLPALCGSFTGFTALRGKKRMVLLQSIALLRKVGAVFGALPCPCRVGAICSQHFGFLQLRTHPTRQRLHQGDSNPLCICLVLDSLLIASNSSNKEYTQEAVLCVNDPN